MGAGEAVAKKRKLLDRGKIMALHNAGWSNKAIAEEVHSTVSTIATIISKIKRGEENGEKQGD